MERFKNAIFKQREDINDRVTEMFELLKELTTSRAPEKVLIIEEAKHPITKNVNSISLIRGEEEKNEHDNATTSNSIETPDGSDAKIPLKKVKKENEAEDGTKNEPIKSIEKALTRAKDEEDMDQDSAHMVAASKVPMLKPGEFELWRMRTEQYIQMIDYALWEVIENYATLPKTQVVEGVTTLMPITSAEDKA
ncbi:hypothetical protein Tco_0585339 [Tanacetum coccineum]